MPLQCNKNEISPTYRLFSIPRVKFLFFPRRKRIPFRCEIFRKIFSRRQKDIRVNNKKKKRKKRQKKFFFSLFYYFL